MSYVVNPKAPLLSEPICTSVASSTRGSDQREAPAERSTVLLLGLPVCARADGLPVGAQWAGTLLDATPECRRDDEAACPWSAARLVSDRPNFRVV